MEIVSEDFGFRKGFDFNNRFDLKTKIDKYTVSTVDLGIDHQFMVGLPPLYYETMIFNWEDEEENPFDYYQYRYSTEEEARIGHQMAIDYVKEHLKEGSNESR